MSHQVTLMTGEVSDVESSLTCPDHKLAIVYLCLTCNIPLCSTCISSRCLDHEIKDVNVVMKIRRQEIKKMLSRFHEQMDRLVDQQAKLSSAKEKNEDAFKNNENSIRTHAQDILKKVQQNGGKALEDLYCNHDKLQKSISMELRTHGIQARLLQNLEAAAKAISQPGKEMLLLMAYPTIQARAPKDMDAAKVAELQASKVFFTPTNGLEVGTVHLKKGEKKPVIMPRNSKKSGAGPQYRHASPQKSRNVTGSRLHQSQSTKGQGPEADISDLSSSAEPEWVCSGLEYGWDVAFSPRGIVVTDHDTHRCKVQLRTLLGILDGDTDKQGVDFQEPSGITYSEALGYILVAEPYLGILQALDPNKLTHRKQFQLTHANNPIGLASMRGGHLVVTEAGARTGISIHDIQGGCIKAWGSWTRDNLQFEKPYYICTDQNDRIIVSDTGNHCVKIFDNSGQLLLKFGQTMNSETFKRPGGVCTTPKNNILVLHCYHGNCNRVSVFSPDGQLIGKLIDHDKTYGELRSLAYKDGIIAMVSEHAVIKYRVTESI